ncbi:beta-ketoacyl-ACP synthase II [Streptomyces ardesiacus]|uniref:beta-ketoacyl-ACP synthase II n=1 Tax=Streptomyces ardesiacus TaxID=285564 RepID=UPI0027E2C45A|nr:beta-ketoacyl-ACP synthase II [Streptomyces ardesiacus]
MPPAAKVVLTGMGAITPVGNSRESTWTALLEGRSGIGPITRFDASGFRTRIAGEVKDFDPVALLGRKRARRAARLSQLAVAAAREAVEDAGLVIGAAEGETAGDRVGAVVNTAVSGMGEVAEAVERMHEDPGEVDIYFVPSVIPNMAACEVAIDLGVHGPVTASALACASGVHALLEARRMILAAEADVVIAGGTDASITPVMFAGLCNMGALSRRNDPPEQASRPFDADRDGFVFGEGAVVCVLESDEHARARGARPYAELLGGALTSDAFHVSAPHPDGTHATAAMRKALESSGVAPNEVDYVCAHGTGTRANDLTETRAVREVFGAHAYDLLVSSPKSMTGHLIGAAGALSAMVAALAVRDGVVPPTINLDTPAAECDLNYVPHRAQKATVDTAIVDAFGFGGQNCVAVLRRP